MKQVVKVTLNGSNIAVYENVIDNGEDYSYLVFKVISGKWTFLKVFDCVSEATEFALCYAMCNG